MEPIKLLFLCVTFCANALTVEQKEVICLADNIYHEARGEGIIGMEAVGQVTINRTLSPEFPDSICAVVKQRSSTACQFSWVCNELEANRNSRAYRTAHLVAARVYVERLHLDRQDNITHGATFFHNETVTPYWAKLFTRTANIGSHRFYIPRG